MNRESQDDLGEGQTVLRDSFCGGQEFQEKQEASHFKRDGIRGEMYPGWYPPKERKGFTKNLEGDMAEGVQGPPCSLHQYNPSNHGL